MMRPLPTVELASASDSAVSDWHYDAAPLASMEDPTPEASDEPPITAADVDQLLAPAPIDQVREPEVIDGVASINANSPHDADERVHIIEAREEHVEETAGSLGLIALATDVGTVAATEQASDRVGVTSEPASEPDDADHRAHCDDARAEDGELTAYELGLVVAAVHAFDGVESIAADEQLELDARAYPEAAREEHVEVAAHEVAAHIEEAAAPSESLGEIDGEPASAEDVAVVAELDAAMAAAEAAATVPASDGELPQAPNDDPGEAPPVAAVADDDAPVGPLPPAGYNPLPKIEIPNDYIPMAESVHALYQLSLNGFEGPLDLLLHLIKRHQVDIFDIPVSFICERYLACIKVMEDLDIDVAAEFLFMASELLHIKSRMLLPKPEGDGAEDDDIDPRAELVRRLLEYQKYKDAAERFGSLDRFNRDVFGRDAEPIQVVTVGEAPLKEVGMFALVKAFEAVLKRQKPEVRHQVMMEQVSVRKRIRALLQMLEGQEPLSFETLLEGHTSKLDIVVTFLALLEMGKLKFLRIFQDEDGMIYVHPKFDDVSVAFQRLEGMDESQYAG